MGLDSKKSIHFRRNWRPLREGSDFEFSRRCSALGERKDLTAFTAKESLMDNFEALVGGSEVFAFDRGDLRFTPGFENSWFSSWS
jgi:hypothetical protein